MRRAALLLAALLSGWFLAGVATAGPALAHATLVSTDPADGARLAKPPAKVTLQFSESVSLADGARVDAGTASVDGAVITIPLRPNLPDSGYLVTYRVISADSHPIAGAYSFAVGKADLLPIGAAAGASRTDPVVAAALPTLRFIGFAGLALAVGVPVLLVLCWPGGWASRLLRRLATWGAVAVVVSALLSFLVQGPYAAGSGLGALLDPSLLSATLGSEAGWAILARAVLAAGLAAALRPAWRQAAPPEVPHLAAAAMFALGLVVAAAAIGHPVAGPWPGLAVTVTTVHVAAMAVWLGGLTGVFLAVLRPGTAAGDLAAVMPRFSRLAFSSVVALVVTGIIQAVREVPSPTGLVATSYGWVLIAKLLLVMVILGAAGVSRVWVQQRLGVRPSRPGGRRSLTVHAFAAESPADAPVRKEGLEDDGAAEARMRAQSENAAEHVPALRRSVLIEVAVGALVLALSAVLVGMPPARSTLVQPLDVTLPLQSASGPDGSVQLTVDPARPGPNTLHVYLFDNAGRLTQPAGIQVTLTEREQQIGPIAVDLLAAG
ncbi:MAG: copper resistance protein CopC/CopD, partial [Geodermatophilales bacterium]|nr:copper resistance protein CopC/CopD [Geodermatophilales bacterium]